MHAHYIYVGKTACQEDHSLMPSLLVGKNAEFDHRSYVLTSLCLASPVIAINHLHDPLNVYRDPIDRLVSHFEHIRKQGKWHLANDHASNHWTVRLAYGDDRVGTFTQETSLIAIEQLETMPGKRLGWIILNHDDSYIGCLFNAVSNRIKFIKFHQAIKKPLENPRPHLTFPELERSLYPNISGNFLLQSFTCIIAVPVRILPLPNPKI